MMNKHGLRLVTFQYVDSHTYSTPAIETPSVIPYCECGWVGGPCDVAANVHISELYLGHLP